MNTVQERSTSCTQDQYTLWQILGIWTSISLPMGLNYWVILPILSPFLKVNAGILYLILTTLGLVWQGVVAFLLLRREVQPFIWEGLKNRVWLYTAANPRTGVRSSSLLLWTIPLVALSQAYYRFGAMDWLNALWVKSLPFLAPPPYTMMRNLAGAAVGQWWLLGLLAVMVIFSYLIGEELIFRGILLPKMNGVFVKWDWLANHILFMTYHLHRISDWPALLFMDWINPWATKRFKSYWVGVIIHGVEAVMPVIMFPLAIMGLV
jgi:hypothetical protein